MKIPNRVFSGTQVFGKPQADLSDANTQHHKADVSATIGRTLEVMRYRDSNIYPGKDAPQTRNYDGEVAGVNAAIRRALQAEPPLI